MAVEAQMAERTIAVFPLIQDVDVKSRNNAEDMELTFCFCNDSSVEVEKLECGFLLIIWIQEKSRK